MRKIAPALVAFMLVAVPTQAAPSCRREVQDAPDPGPVVELNGVAASGSDEAWAVGSFNDGGEFSRNRTLAIHWDGSNWATYETPNLGGSREQRLVAVDASAPDDVWAVGVAYQVPERGSGSRGPDEPLVMHFDGSKWSIVPTPSTSHSATSLADVSVVDREEVWIVGHRSSRSRDKSLVLRLDNGTGKVVSSGNRPDQERSLSGVTDLGSNELWAVGHRAWSDGRQHALGLHLDTGTRTSWRIPKPRGARYPSAYDVSASGTDNVWTVGWYSVPNSSEVFVSTYDGTTWKRQEAPPIGDGGINDFKSLRGVAVTSHDNVWTVGHATSNESGHPRSHGVLAHWDGSSWTVDERPEGESSWLSEIDLFAPDEGWAVGSMYVEPSQEEPSFAPPLDGLIVRLTCS